MPRTETLLMTGWRFALGAELPAADSFKEIYLPHDWARDMPIDPNMAERWSQGFRNRWSIGWYKKDLTLEKKAGYRYLLYFGGIMEKSTVWVNGREAGGRLYGYSTFTLDITDLLNDGDNELTVRADNTTHPADRWYSGCGIYRTVKLMEIEDRHLDRWNIVTSSEIGDNIARLKVNCGVDGRVRATLFSPSMEKVTSAVSDGEMTLEVKEPLLWSPDHPHLYTLTLELLDGERVADSLDIRVGLRDARFVNCGTDTRPGFYINGKRETLKGVCVHQDFAIRGIAAKSELWRERLLTLKEMGCNFVRTSHHVFSEEFLDLCDELGFFVYDECFDKWVFGAYERCFDSQWRADVDAMVKRDRNHPSVIIWGVGNEETNQGQTSMLNILRMLCDYVRELDPTRPVTYAMKPHFLRDGDPKDDLTVCGYDEMIEYAAKIANIVDVICCNYMDQWYEKLHALVPEKLIIGTEVYQYFAGIPDNFQNFEEKIPSLVPERLDYCVGSAIWTGIDYLGESLGYPFKGRSNSPIKSNCTRRPMFYVLQSYWTSEPMVHFSVIDYNFSDGGTKWHWSSPAFVDHWDFPDLQGMVMVPYMLVSNCDEVKLTCRTLDDERCFEILLPSPRDCQNKMVRGFVPYVKGQVIAVGYNNGVEVCRHILYTPDAPTALKFEKSEYTARAREGEEVLVTLFSRDERGTHVIRDTRRVTFTAEGDGEVIAVDNASFASDDPYGANSIHMHEGCASALVRLKAEARKVTVRATADGLTSTECVITTK